MTRYRTPPSENSWDEFDWIDGEDLDGPPDGVISPPVSPSMAISGPGFAPPSPPRVYRSAPGSPTAAKKPARPGPADWRQRLRALGQTFQVGETRQRLTETWPAGRHVYYVLDVAATMTGSGLALDVLYRDRKADGAWTKGRPLKSRLHEVDALPEAIDREILGLLVGPRSSYGGYAGSLAFYGGGPHRYYLTATLQRTLLPILCETGRCALRLTDLGRELGPLRWDGGRPWQIWLEVRPLGDGRHAVRADLRRGDERMDLLSPTMLVAGGLVFTADRVAGLVDEGLFPWLVDWRTQGETLLAAGDEHAWLTQVLALSVAPRLDLPEALAFDEVAVAPRPRLVVRMPKGQGPDSRLGGHLGFDYAGWIVSAGEAGRGIYEVARQRFVRRDPGAERAAAARLAALGFRERKANRVEPGGATIDLSPRHLPRVVSTLLGEGWHVEAEGKRYRRGGAIQIEVASGVDWFELHGRVEFDGAVATLPELLAALRRGEGTVRLGDGTFGLLPEEWLRRYGALAGLGEAHGRHLRFTRAQVSVLDALLGAQHEITCDETFARAREELRRFEGIRPEDPPEGFSGTLRPYQRDGLGWLHFLRRFGFGGCLADDMGLGKTVMVLAFLEGRREEREQRAPDDPTRPGPSLAVVPRSLVFNWKQEAARFTPKLRVLDHTGAGRLAPGAHFDDHDLVLTTYGTLRRDAAAFAETRFDCAILDEAQAIKNAGTDSARAARLLRADHRMALSGTPVENHLGELWSLFEFLNPGMLGAATAFRAEGGALRDPDEPTRRLLARALRPFVLRRSKEQVARDLPPRVEQTLYCELEPVQRRLYDELRQHYRQTLLGRAPEDFNRAKIQVLEALLRLRQAACHPGLIDRERVGESSAKLEALLPQLAEVVAEGHKALVFSQFTSLLAIVRQRLVHAGITYEYLDGKTQDRAARVDRFQADAGCPVFLISLRAGGLGLNLTSADYVFLLDPWWNPAVEAQAIDRAHRIGQSRQVFAYRLIARDTVEEKIIELQQTKRSLADAIIGADNSLIRSLTREDLELLLS
ncbi:MAG TPA: DEAD/DEAH box helicase [Candidatus Binatia bacterium]|nr:DEAD/DEAH box helicase [Candidatus Binatia bacterium]